MKSKFSVAAVCCALLIAVTGNVGARSVTGASTAVQPTSSHAGAVLSSKGLSTILIVTVTRLVGPVVIATMNTETYVAGASPQLALAAKAEVATLDQ